jgi:hypothetical protein
MYVCFWPKVEICFALSHEMMTYNTLGKSGQRAPHGSFMLCACFFEQSAVSSSSQSISLPSRYAVSAPWDKRSSSSGETPPRFLMVHPTPTMMST